MRCSVWPDRTIRSNFRLISGVIANAALFVHMLRSIIHAFHIVKLCVRHYTSSAVAFDPTNNRIFVVFTDSTGAVRGETSVAVETQ